MNEKQLTRHQRRRIRTREQLKQAGIELLLEKGYDAISVQHVTETADLGRGTFYLHFKDKEDLVWSIIKDGIDATDAKAQQNLEEVPPDRPEYFGYLNIFRHADQNRDLYRVMLGSQGSAMLTARVHDYLANELLSDMKNFGIYRDFDIPREVLAQVVTGATIRLISWWLAQEKSYTPEEMADMLYASLHNNK